jgi:hypothetical protein
MSQPVWILSVDLQTKTATFQSGLADAAKSARGAFTEIKSGSGEMGREVGGNMMEARHGVMLLGEEFGVHLPRALTTFIAGIGPIGAAMEAAFPFLAIAVGATLLIEHLVKMREEGQKLTEDQVRFGTAVQNAFNQLDEKLLQAGIRADELRGDHLGALSKQLELIDRQSMAELAHSFEEVEKAADIAFGDIQSHWYTFGIGSTGAKHALESFKGEYDKLLAQGKDKDASDLLRGTRESAEKVLALQKQAAATSQNTGAGGSDRNKLITHEAALNGLKASGVGFTEKEVTAQQALVDALNAQVGIEQHVADLKRLQKDNATVSTHKTMDSEAAARAKEALAAEQRASEEAKKFYEDAYRNYVTIIDQGEKEKIAATKEGTAGRLAVIDASIKEEQQEQMQSTSFYRELLTQRVQTVRQMAEEEAKAQADAAKEAAENTEKMGQMSLAAESLRAQLLNSIRRVSDQERLQEAIKAANDEYDVQLAAIQKEAAALDKGNKDYQLKLQQAQDKELQLTMQHENAVAALQDKAQEDQQKSQQTALAQMENNFAQSFLRVLEGHESFAKMMSSAADKMTSNLISSAIDMADGLDAGKIKQAEAAARWGFNWGAEYGGPAAPVLAPVMAATFFAGVMAFEDGGIVPGIGRGDTVPAMLTPGEGIVPGSVMDGLSAMARCGNMGGGVTNHVHVHFRPNLQALDASGMDKVLDKHGDKLQKHFEKTLRRMNK